MNKILNGKLLAEEKIEIFKERISKLSILPKLTVIMVGDNPASEVYVRNKVKYCEKVGITSETIKLSAEITEDELISTILKLNNDSSVHGILVQFPLPKHMDEFKIKCAISKFKDVDCFTPHNIGMVYMNRPFTLPCTPAGVLEILKKYNISVEGKKALIIGRSLIAGKPMAELLNQLNASTTLVHSKTPKEDLNFYLKNSDIIISAAGISKFITGDMLNDNQVLIDISINRDENGKLCGDFDHSCYDKASLYTPVPGGVGPMTVAMLIENTILCTELLSILDN